MHDEFTTRWFESAAMIVAAIFSGGIFSYLREIWRARRADKAASSTAGLRSAEISQADAVVNVVTKARDDLAADNRLLRATIADIRADYAADKDAWQKEKQAMRDEIDSLENKLRALLNEFEALKLRHA